MAQARFSIRAAVAEGFDFWRQNWTKAAGPLVIGAGAFAFYQYSFMTKGPTSVVLLGVLVYLLAGLAARATYFRIALGLQDGTSGPYGLQWRGLESRLLGVALLTGLAYAIVALVATFLMAIFFMGIAERPPAQPPQDFEALLGLLSPNGRLVVSVIGLAAIAALVVLWARLSMAAPATAAQGQVRVFSSARLTKGQIAPIVGTRFLIELPIFILQMLAGQFGQLVGDPALGAMAQIMAGMIGLFFFVAIDVGSLSYIYRRLATTSGGAA
jgi:hypothetical protein